MKTTPLAVNLLLALAATAAAQSTPDLQGLWGATLRFGPDIRGPLLIYRTPQGWRADIAGFSVAARRDGQSFAFELPDGQGSFRGSNHNLKCAVSRGARTYRSNRPWNALLGKYRPTAADESTPSKSHTPPAGIRRCSCSVIRNDCVAGSQRPAKTASTSAMGYSVARARLSLLSAARWHAGCVRRCWVRPFRSSLAYPFLLQRRDGLDT